MSELDLITFVGISESWHAFNESRFNISFSISAFEILLNLKYLYVLLLFIATILGWFLYCSIYLAIGSSIRSIFADLSWYFGIFRFETTLTKNLLKISATIYWKPLTIITKSFLLEVWQRSEYASERGLLKWTYFAKIAPSEIFD